MLDGHDDDEYEYDGDTYAVRCISAYVFDISISVLIIVIIKCHSLRICMFAVIGGMLCKSDKPSIILLLFTHSEEHASNQRRTRISILLSLPDNVS